MIIGYARVSTRGQDLTLQQAALVAAGCVKVHAEKASGARSDRPALSKMLKALDAGDQIVVTRLDRIARSSRDLLNIIHRVSEAGAMFRSLADPWCDTTTPHGRLILTIMAGLAEFERELIMARTQAGIARAREIGRQFGRKPKLGPREKLRIAERHAAGATMKQLADEFEVGQATIHRAVHGG